MSKFKVGDRVRVVDYEVINHEVIGKTGAVVEDPFLVKTYVNVVLDDEIFMKTFSGGRAGLFEEYELELEGELNV